MLCLLLFLVYVRVMAKLNQVVAIEKGVKTRVHAFLTDAYKKFQKSSLFSGLTRQYLKKDEEGEHFPDESVRVQYSGETLLAEIATNMTELLDVTAQKDWANCEAKADVVVDGNVLLAGVPSTYLLFLEKQLNDLKDELSKLPILDPAHEWHQDSSLGQWRTTPTMTHKTKKMPKVIVRYEATEHHPAQTELVHTDEIVGYWSSTLLSGAMPVVRVQELQTRLQKIIKAVKFARESANESFAPQVSVGDKLFKYLLQ